MQGVFFGVRNTKGVGKVVWVMLFVCVESRDFLLWEHSY